MNVKCILYTLVFTFMPMSVWADNPQLLMDKLAGNDPVAKCEAAYILGEQKSGDALQFLAEMTESEDSALRQCSIEALGLYGDDNFCQDFHEIWLSDKDKNVRKTAGIAIILNDCERHISRSKKYSMDSKSCGYTQFFINKVKDAIVNTPAEKDWKQDIHSLDIKGTITDKDLPDEILEMRLNLVFSVLDWGDTVSQVRSFTSTGNFEETRWKYRDEIEQMKWKEEFVKRFCPSAGFPDFFFWDSVVISKTGTDK